MTVADTALTATPSAEAAPDAAALAAAEAAKPAGGDAPAKTAAELATEAAAVAAAAEKPAWKEFVADATKSEAENAAAKVDHDKAKPADDEPKGAPETYADFTVPEGVTLAGEDLKDIQAFSKGKNWSQKDAQEAVDKITALRVRDYQNQVKAWEDTQTKWVADAKADKEIGGAKFDENVGDARKAIEQFGTPELKDALLATGGGNHPEIIRVFARIGKAISEDKTLIGGAKGSAAQPDAASILYPDKPSKE